MVSDDEVLSTRPRERTHVALVSPDPLARISLASLLEAGGEVEVRSSAGSPRTSASPGADVTVLVWDLGLTPRELLPVVARLAPSLPPVLALVVPELPRPEVLAAGARGVVPRETKGAALVAAVRAVAEGLVVVDAGALAGWVVSRASGGDEVERPTARETEVLALLAEGLSNRGIAQRLSISEHTAKFHVNSLIGKLGVQGRTEAVTRAVRLGWLVL